MTWSSLVRMIANLWEVWKKNTFILYVKLMIVKSLLNPMKTLQRKLIKDCFL